MAPSIAIGAGQQHCCLAPECLESLGGALPVWLAKPAIQLDFWSGGSWLAGYTRQQPGDARTKGFLSGSDLPGAVSSSRPLDRRHERLHVGKSKFLIQAQCAGSLDHDLGAQAGRRSIDLVLKPGKILAQPCLTAVAIVGEPGTGSPHFGQERFVLYPDPVRQPSLMQQRGGGKIQQHLHRTALPDAQSAVCRPDGRLGIGQSSPVEVLLYLAAAPLLHQGRLADWVGVQHETLLAEVWAPRARFPDNRDSGQTWLGKNLARLQDEIDRAAAGLGAEVVVKRRGALRLNEEFVLSDVEAYMAAVERAPTAHGAGQLGAAEEALGTRAAGLLPRVARQPTTAGPKVQLYRWLGEPHWERAAKRLEALGREAAMLLARAYRDAGRHDEALALYDQLLGEDPLDRRASEGLLIAAAGTGDVVQLEQAWQQVCACLCGEGDADARSLYEQVRREVNGEGSLGVRGI